MTVSRAFAAVATFMLAICAFAVTTSALAEQRAWTCAPGPGGYNDAHCVNNVAGGFKAVEITNGMPTSTVISNENTAEGTAAASVAKLKGKVAGIAVEIQCVSVGGSGSLTNATASVAGTGVFELKGCTVTAPTRECIVSGGGFTTKEVAATTAGQPGFAVKFAPASGTEFVGIPIEKCRENLPPKGTYPVTGSLVDSISGATTTITHAASTGQGTLFFGGNAAGIEGSLTSRMKGGNPIYLK